MPSYLEGQTAALPTPLVSRLGLFTINLHYIHSIYSLTHVSIETGRIYEGLVTISFAIEEYGIVVQKYCMIVCAEDGLIQA